MLEMARNPRHLAFGCLFLLLPSFASKPALLLPRWAKITTLKDTSEALTRKGQRGYKQLVRSQTVKIEPEQNYRPGQVAAALNLSYDSALRRMQKMKGVADFGIPTRR